MCLVAITLVLLLPANTFLRKAQVSAVLKAQLLPPLLRIAPLSGTSSYCFKI
jgi:hypothetical protein